jgi:5-methylcytosine-specific restriction endonuclease McrA
MRQPDPILSSRPYRALLAQVRAEEPCCWLCGDPIDLDLNAQTDPWGSTLDHVIPRSTPGFTRAMALDRDNARHCHRICNAKRQATSPQHGHSSSTRDWGRTTE